MCIRLVLHALVLSILFAPASARAQWQVNGVPLTTAQGYQFDPAIASDGSGGSIVVWTDNRVGFSSGSVLYDIYAQRVDAEGVLRWTPDGVAVSAAGGPLSPLERDPEIISDGSGGCIIVWERGVIYAQRLDASGTVQWAANGISVRGGSIIQRFPKLVSDESGGAIVTWEDGSSGDIHAQRIDASGTVQWTTGGVALCAATGYQKSPKICSDGSGGAIVAWVDGRSGEDHIYARRVDASGSALWATDGVPVCTTESSQGFCVIVEDGSGGCVIAWADRRNGVYDDIYVQRLDASGVALWAADGVPLSTAADFQDLSTICSDGMGGAIVTWSDVRTGFADIYAQRVDASGSILWTSDGVPLCTATGTQKWPTIVPDGSGGAFVSWIDHRSFEEVYMQRINASGDPLWAANGIVVNTTTNGLSSHDLLSDGSGGVISTWSDRRNFLGPDIYAQRIRGDGTTRVVLAGLNAVPGPEGLELLWMTTEELDHVGFHVWRREVAPLFTEEVRLNRLLITSIDRQYRFMDTGAEAGHSYEYRLADLSRSGVLTFHGPFVVKMPGNVLLDNPWLSPAAPNPARGRVTLRFSLPQAGNAWLRVFDITGKLVRVIVDGTLLPSGLSEMVWDGTNTAGEPVVSGVYFYRLDAAGTENTRKLYILR